MNQNRSVEYYEVADKELGLLSHLPRFMWDYALLARWERPIGTWLLLFPCWWGLAISPVPFAWPYYLLFAVGAFAMRGAGCTINDLADKEFDAKVERTRNRPLASGRVTSAQALIFLLFQLLCGLMVLLLLPVQARYVALASVPLIIIYPFMKRYTYWPQIFLGLAFNWGVLVGSAVSGQYPGIPAWMIYFAGIFWTLGYDTIYAHQDKEDDLKIGVKSTALKLGASSQKWIAVFYAVTIALLGLGLFLQTGQLTVIAALLLPACHFIWQIKSLDIDDRPTCLKLFRSNRDAGLLVLIALLFAAIYT